MLPKVNLNRSC